MGTVFLDLLGIAIAVGFGVAVNCGLDMSVWVKAGVEVRGNKANNKKM
ncbi:hypothetical protein [Nostoc sp.]